MKIKIKDEMNDIRLKVTHKELILIKIALEHCDYRNITTGIINNSLFDKDEIGNDLDIMDEVQAISRKIAKKTEKINVW